ncbi:restriction endonuclease subunit S [Burkholderia pseudomallei]|uniref:restriction endonuclease subunit S n=1 Tax=Burkholderia pseudomallei TaxID=28450 RepID=UPI0003C07F45|nr:restriction endonuclease subunit S [Burkholderia pseudomallei]AGZ28858.1 type I restriction modification DNA specificity domain protein [Burkholderia pseudomallei NCTC 13179]
MYEAIPDRWQRRSLSSLGEYENGFAFSELHWSEHGLPIVRIAQITGSQGIVDRYPGRLPATFRIDSGDLIFSWSGTLAVVRWSGGPAWLNQHLFKVVPAASVEKSLLFHLLLASVAEMNKRTHGSTMKHIKRGELREFFVSLPVDGGEQRKLAQILDTLDATIQETDAIIAKLKVVKQGLLHDLLTWGIDANGELRPPYSEAPHLYKWSALGWIPKDWTCSALQPWLDGKPKNGYSPQEAGAWTGIQMLGLGCLTADGFQPAQLKPAPRDDRRLCSAFLSEGDLLMSRSNTRDLVGLAGVYRDVGTPCTYPDLMMRLRPSPETSAEFLQFVLRSPQLRRQIQAQAVGTSGSMVKISGKIVSELVVAIPDRTEQEVILSRLLLADRCLTAEIENIAKLRQVKAGLMDDLLCGRVRVTPLLAEGEQ